MRDLLADPVHWVQGAKALDADGLKVNPCSPEAVCWCIVGAFQKVQAKGSRSCIYDCLTEDPAGKYLQVELDKTQAYRRPWVFNDKRNHPEVIGLIDAAISNAKKDANV